MVMPQNRDWADEVLAFWFEELGPRDWFKKSDALDAQIVTRFAALHSQLGREPAEGFLTSPLGALAAIILFDQLSRNLFRGDPRSFASDTLALAVARGVVANEWDKEISQARRVFLYLPFEHSEDIIDQDMAVELIEALGDEEFTRYAHAHREVIQRFGRFPHRNAVLGRKSTPCEETYLSQPGSGF